MLYSCFESSASTQGSAGRTRTNGLLRDYFPKGTDLGIHTLEHLLAVEEELNNRPRMILDDRTPHQLLTALLASQGPPVLRR